jgi:WD40 repeat protein
MKMLAGHGDEITGLAHSPDGSRLASGCYNGEVCLWDVTTGERLWRGAAKDGPVYSLRFTPNGKVLLSASLDEGGVSAWDTATGRLLNRFGTGHPDLTVLALASDGRTIVTGCRDGSLRVWDWTTGLESARYGTALQPRTLTFSPDGRTLLALTNSHMFQTWDCKTGRLQTERELAPGRVRAAAFSPDGTLAATSLFSTTTQVWDTATGETLGAVTANSALVMCLSFAPDGRTLASGDLAATVRLWDVPTLSLRSVLPPSVRGLATIDLSPDGKTLTAGDLRNVYHVGQGREVSRLDFGNREPTGLAIPYAAFSPDGVLLASARGGQVFVWESATRKERWTRNTTVPLAHVAWMRDGKLLAAIDERGGLHLWEVATGKLRLVWGSGQGKILALAAAPDGKTLALAGRDSTVLLVDTEELCRQSAERKGKR